MSDDSNPKGLLIYVTTMIGEWVLGLFSKSALFYGGPTLKIGFIFRDGPLYKSTGVNRFIEILFLCCLSK